MRADRDFVIAAVRAGARIEYAPEALRDDEALMLGEEVTYEVGVPRARGSLGAPAAI